MAEGQGRAASVQMLGAAEVLLGPLEESSALSHPILRQFIASLHVAGWSTVYVRDAVKVHNDRVACADAGSSELGATAIEDLLRTDLLAIYELYVLPHAGTLLNASSRQGLFGVNARQANPAETNSI
jgi:hypothetical protein